MENSTNRVVILTAGKGSRLNKRTKYFNKALLKVGNKAVISHTIDVFPLDTEFIIGIGYMGDMVKQYLNIVYPERKFTFVDIDKIEGKGSGPGYSLMCCKDHLQCPFYFVSCDTIISWIDGGYLQKNNKYIYNLLDLDFNWSAFDFAPKTESYKYCTVELDGDNITKIFDKSRHGTEKVYVGVSFIKNYKNFWTNLSSTSETVDKEVQVSPAILNIKEMKAVKVEWFDTGTEETLQETRKNFPEVKNLEKLNEEIYFFEKFIVKYFYDKTTIKNRIARTKRLGNVVPEILKTSENFYKYKYIAGHDLSESDQSDKLMSSLLMVAKERLWKKIELNDFQQEQFSKACQKFYYDKTLARLDKIQKEKKYIYSSIQQDKKEIINNLQVPPITQIIDTINWDYLAQGIPVKFHGDFVFSNILHTNDNEFKFIDWRQDFGGLIDCGDIYYDFSKLYTEMVAPRDSIKNYKFYFDKNYSGIKTFIEVPLIIEKCKDYFEYFINSEQYDILKIKLLTGVIMLNMTPLHEYPLDKWLFYYGKYFLWKTLSQEKSNDQK